MRNLKRALSLALASVMVLGLMVVGSGASYADVTSEENQEAIEVLQAVGVMVGDDEGNFNPDKNVTRNEMAVVMSNLLDLKVEDFNAADIPFTDVPSWAVAYVAACYADGITSGTSATTYGGSNTVTAAQAALMMMKALGYFQYQGDFDQEWTLATIKKGSEIGIFDGITVDRTSPLTRNDVAQMALNALKLNMVTFTGEVGIEIPTAGGQPIVVGYKAEYTPRTSANSKYNQISAGTTDIASNNQYYVQLGEELYNGDLRLSPDIDAFGRPARYWEYDGKEIGVYVDKSKMIAEFTTEVTGADLYETLTRNTVAKYDVNVYIDGLDEAPTRALSNVWFTKNDIARNNDEGLGDTGNGTLTQVFVDNEEDVVTIAIVNTYLAIADDDYDDNNGELDVTVYGIEEQTAGADDYVKTNNQASETSEPFTLSTDDFAIEDYLKDDAMLVTVADGEVQDVLGQPEIIDSAEISSFRIDNHVTVDGTKYNFASSAEYDWETLNSWTDGTGTINMKDQTYDVYLDQYGYAIGVKVLDAVNNYLFVTGIDLNSSNLNNRTADANVIFLDGTMDTVEINMTKSTLNIDTRTPENNAILNTWCTYTVSGDVYTVKEVSNVNDNVTNGIGGATNSNKDKLAQYQSQPADALAASMIEINSKRTSVAGGTSTYNRVYGNDDTVYLTVSLAELDNGATNNYAVIDDVDSVITGIDNANLKAWHENYAASETDKPTVSGSITGGHASAGVYALYDDDGYVIAAVVVGEDAGTAKNLVYAHTSNVVAEGYDKTTDTWSWSRMVVSAEGEEIEIVERGDSLEYLDEMDQNRWYQVKYNADGDVIEVTDSDAAAYAGDIDKWDLTLATGNLAGQEGDYVTNINLLEESINEYDNVLYYEYQTTQPELIGKTLYVDTAAKEGFRVDENVAVVLQRNTRNTTWNTTFYSGVSRLERIVDDLVERADGTYRYCISAIIEDGKAITVVIRDMTSDYNAPNWGTNQGDIRIDGLAFRGAAGMDVTYTNLTGTAFMATDVAHVKVTSSDNTLVYQTGPAGEALVAGEAAGVNGQAVINFGLARTPQTQKGDYRVELTITDGTGTVKGSASYTVAVG